MLHCVPQLCTMICTHIKAVLMDDLWFQGFIFVLHIYLNQFVCVGVSFLCLCIVRFLSIVSGLTLVVVTSAVNCLDRLVSEMSYYVSCVMLNSIFILTTGCESPAPSALA